MKRFSATVLCIFWAFSSRAQESYIVSPGSGTWDASPWMEGVIDYSTDGSKNWLLTDNTEVMFDNMEAELFWPLRPPSPNPPPLS
ncbi:hypothetical protein P0Y35_05035 [Kiritimatiellaeota bacterium B1221]|nr:hypothetical protein [Kiritimatiellaeota bacterium B1221]